MNLRSSTTLATIAPVPGFRPPDLPAVTFTDASLPRVGCTAMGVGLMAYHLNRAGLHDEAETLIRNFEIATGAAGEEDDHVER